MELSKLSTPRTATLEFSSAAGAAAAGAAAAGAAAAGAALPVLPAMKVLNALRSLAPWYFSPAAPLEKLFGFL